MFTNLEFVVAVPVHGGVGPNDREIECHGPEWPEHKTITARERRASGGSGLRPLMGVGRSLVL